MPRPWRIPPILLEGDEMPAPLISGPGRRFALGPTPPMPPSPALALGADAGRLPAAYGTRRLWLAARDPQWLYANWDLSSEEMQEREGRAVSGHLTLRIHENAVGPAPVLEIPLARGVRSWFVRVERGGVEYIAELACAEPGLGWQTVLTSNPVTAPPDGPATAAMRVTLAERKHRSVGFGLDYRSDDGPGARAFWEHRNLSEEDIVGLLIRFADGGS